MTHKANALHYVAHGLRHFRSADGLVHTPNILMNFTRALKRPFGVSRVTLSFARRTRQLGGYRLEHVTILLYLSNGMIDDVVSYNSCM